MPGPKVMSTGDVYCTASGGSGSSGAYGRAGERAGGWTAGGCAYRRRRRIWAATAHMCTHMGGQASGPVGGRKRMDRLSGDGIPDWRHSDWRSDEQEWRQSDKHEEQVPADLRCGLQSYLDQMHVSRGPSGGRLVRFWLPIILCLQLVRRQERVQVVSTPAPAWHGASPRVQARKN
jgi:hypothetical protein